MDIDLEHKKLHEAGKKIIEDLNKSDMPIGFCMSEWLRDRQTPLTGVSFIDFPVFVDFCEVENKTDKEIYELISNRLIEKLEMVLTGLKK